VQYVDTRNLLPGDVQSDNSNGKSRLNFDMLNSCDHLCLGFSQVREVAIGTLSLAATVKPPKMLGDRAGPAIVTGVNAVIVVTALVSCAVVQITLVSVTLAGFSGHGEQCSGGEQGELGELHDARVNSIK
jgi:hypothetical protein